MHTIAIVTLLSAKPITSFIAVFVSVNRLLLIGCIFLLLGMASNFWLGDRHFECYIIDCFDFLVFL